VGLKTAYIGLGSNLGNRVQALEAAVNKLKAMSEIYFLAMSGLYETSAVEFEGGSFLNAVAAVRTGMGPGMLLEVLLSTETALGRTRKQGKTGSRAIDLDLLLYGDTVIDGKGLTVPHPRMLRRRFVMEPLAELAPDLKIPPTGIKASESAASLAVQHPEQEIKRLGTLEEVKAGGDLRSKNQDPRF
jgi:2-amino-4-hydroxy-6-hydroxymethyldihydropteridine diphosphokinase